MAEQPLALIVGANRGIGLGVVREMLRRDWSRDRHRAQPGRAPAALHELAEQHRGRLDDRETGHQRPAADGWLRRPAARHARWMRCW